MNSRFGSPKTNLEILRIWLSKKYTRAAPVEEILHKKGQIILEFFDSIQQVYYSTLYNTSSNIL
jgi:hypothetical protein